MIGWGWLTGLMHGFSGTMGLVNSQANELSGSRVGTRRWGSCSRDWQRPLPPPPACDQGPQEGDHIGWKLPLLVAPAIGAALRDGLPLPGGLWIPGRQKGVPVRAPQMVWPVVSGDGGSLWPCLQMHSVPPSGQLPKKPVSCMGWWFVTEKLFRKVKGGQGLEGDLPSL